MKQESWQRKVEYERRETEAIDSFLAAREDLNRNNTEASRGVYDEKREKLRAMQEKRVQAAKERNYAQYSRSGERMTGYHFNIMNKGRAAREIRQLKVREQGRSMVKVPGAAEDYQCLKILSRYFQSF